MKEFMGRNFLLSSDTAEKLYHDYAASMPIIDYHCHINPQEIAQNKRFENIAQVWLGGDHYKWRQMRSNGVDEKYITGDASDREKFQKWAETLEKAIGNPLYHWSHLELQRYFGYHGYLSAKTAQEVWDLCNEKLQTEELSVRGIIKQSNVETICTTDDPIDSLEWHQVIADDESFDVKVLPAWRPDNAMNLEVPHYLEYLDKLRDASGVTVTSFATLMVALKNRLAYFEAAGCRVSDHALNYIMYAPASDEKIEEIFAKRLRGDTLTQEEILQFKTKFMMSLAQQYTEMNWVMQLHFGCKRNNNGAMFQQLGPDTGYDCINNYAPSDQAADFLNALVSRGHLPRTVLYSLNPNDDAYIGTLLGCFQDSSARGKVQQGSAWWFNDNRVGMTNQMTSLANLGLLSNFLGMLTDSRSFLSYTRHEYFRRVLCDLIGGWVEEGAYPADYTVLQQMIEDISYNNTKTYFGF